jgi:hypothetical protein
MNPLAGVTISRSSGVQRRYQPDAAVINNLVDALCQLLLETAEDAIETPCEPDLLSAPQRARNVS